MQADFSRVIIDEMPEAVVGNALELCPFPEGADRRFLARWKDTTEPKAHDIGKLTGEGSG
jgi:hypothetical protein